jgi:hypothetical protein
MCAVTRRERADDDRAGPSAPSAHFRLGPATRLLWRTAGSVQLELGSRGVVVDGLPPSIVGLLAARTTTPADDDLVLHADERRALDDLHERGFLWQRPGPTTGSDVRLAPPAPRLARELTAVAVRFGEQAADVLRARRNASVVVRGCTGAAVHLAALLAAAGVGRVHCSTSPVNGGTDGGSGAVQSGFARLLHAMPGGIEPGDEGTNLAAAAADAITRAAPETNTLPLPLDQRPDLTVLAADAPIDENRRAALHAARAPHLVVTAAPDHGVVGPLVVPGLTSCLRCADLYRRDRDPAWPALAAQLAVVPVRGVATDVALATVIVGTAALQALTFLDGGDPDCVDASLELHLPDWRLRRRSRPVHPECGCADSFDTA